MKGGKIYINIIFIGVILLAVVYTLFLIVSYKGEKGVEIISPYECGFNFIRGSRKVFSFRFFLISILFLIFDVEISLIVIIPFLKRFLIRV